MHGKPQRPQDLARHNCLLTRSVDGIVMDLWSFRRGEQAESVTVTGWLVTSNPHRDGAMNIVLEGGAVVRGIDLANRERLLSGALPVPVLTDWEATEAPPVNLLSSPQLPAHPARAAVHRLRHRDILNWIGNATGGSCRAGDRSGCGSTRGSRQR